MSRITKTEVPRLSGLHSHVRDGDFIDCYATHSDATPREAAEIMTAYPWWVNALMFVRRLITAPFGLNNDTSQHQNRVGMFPVCSESSAEIIAGFDDKHLDFRIAIVSETGRVYFATWVHPHHWGGRLYLAVVMPFHVLIVRNALARLPR